MKTLLATILTCLTVTSVGFADGGDDEAPVEVYCGTSFDGFVDVSGLEHTIASGFATRQAAMDYYAELTENGDYDASAFLGELTGLACAYCENPEQCLEEWIVFPDTAGFGVKVVQDPVTGQWSLVAQMDEASVTLSCSPCGGS